MSVSMAPHVSEAMDWVAPAVLDDQILFQRWDSDVMELLLHALKHSHPQHFTWIDKKKEKKKNHAIDEKNDIDYNNIN